MTNKIKVIDLLNLIANKEKMPKKIKYRKNIYIYNTQYEIYYLENRDVCGLHSLFNVLCTDGDLNDEVEIIDEIEKPKEIKEVFDWLEENMNKQHLFDLKIEDRNQITAYFKGTNDRFCQFYINPIMELIREEKEYE